MIEEHLNTTIKMWNTSSKTGSLYALPCKIRSSKINIGQRKEMKTKQENRPNETTTKKKQHQNTFTLAHFKTSNIWSTMEHSLFKLKENYYAHILSLLLHH